MQSDENEPQQNSAPHDQTPEKLLNQAKLAEEYNMMYRKLIYAFQDREIFNIKNLTPFTYWLTLDAQYFSMNPDYERKKLSTIRRGYSKSKEGASNALNMFSSDQDHKFILKTRKLVSEQNGDTMNIDDIRSTKTDQVIEILQKYACSLERQNDSKLEEIVQSLQKQKKQQKDTYQKLDIHVLPTQNLFRYMQFQSRLITDWIKQEKKIESKSKCQICWRPGKLIKCTNCGLHVHAYCYPSLAADSSKLYNPNLQTFICQPCQLDEKTDEMSQPLHSVRNCALCPCTGGNFIKTSKSIENFQIRQNEEDAGQLSFKIIKQSLNENNSKQNQYIHLACFIWNPECTYNVQTKLVDGTNLITPKKFASICDICGISVGSAIPCAAQNCRKSYHPQCARRKRLDMVYIKAATQKFIEIYCPRHHPQKNYELMKKSHAINCKEVKKFFEGVDRQIKRHQNQNQFTQKKMLFEYDICAICREPENGQAQTFCKSCRKWHHSKCGSACPNCT